MIRTLTIGAMFLALLGLVPSLTAAQRVFIRPSVGYFGPVYGWHPRPWYGERVYVPAPVTGELKINTNDKDARVYVNGGYLGVARHLKKFDLWPGNYEIELRDARGDALFKERVSIMPGRTTEFDAMGVTG